jgi:outer membrane immunogenic protein
MMKRLVLAGIGALAVLTTMGAANAADMERRQAMPAKAPIYMPGYNWTGFYVGINGGGGWGGSDWSNAAGTAGSGELSGALVGGTIGYNYQMGRAVFGVEGDFGWSNIRGSSACVATTCSINNDWLGTARGRIGYAFDRVMPFVTGGAAFGNVKTSVASVGDTEDTKLGWTVGGGVEAAIAGPWTAKAEYLYVDLGNTSSAVGFNATFHTNIVRGGLNYRF